jgi:hypothetical protein
MFGKSDIISYNLTENAESNHDFAIPLASAGPSWLHGQLSCKSSLID